VSRFALQRTHATTLFAQIRTRRWGTRPTQQSPSALFASGLAAFLPVAGGIMSGAMSPHISIDRDAVSAFCRRHHITRLALFGSVLRDDFGPESDIDVLVEFQAGHVPGLKFVSIERELSRLLHGRRVDMVTPKFLNPRIREQVLGSAEPLYVAA
jgi:predicted nucleotidyltransferase